MEHLEYSHFLVSTHECYQYVYSVCGQFMEHFIIIPNQLLVIKHHCIQTFNVI